MFATLEEAKAARIAEMKLISNALSRETEDRSWPPVRVNDLIETLNASLTVPLTPVTKTVRLTVEVKTRFYFETSCCYETLTPEDVPYYALEEYLIYSGGWDDSYREDPLPNSSEISSYTITNLEDIT